MHVLFAFLLAICLVRASLPPSQRNPPTIITIKSPCNGKVNNIYTRPGRSVSPRRPVFALVCYDGNTITSDATIRVYLHWVIPTCYGIVRDVLIEPNTMVVAGQWLATVEEGTLDIIEEETSDMLVDYSDQ